MRLLATTLQRHGAVYMSDPLYRIAWLVWPLMVALFFICALFQPVRNGAETTSAVTPSTVAAEPPRPAPETLRSSASTPELYKRASVGDRAAEAVLKERAEEGLALAQVDLANLYDPLVNKASANASRTLEAIEWYRRAAKEDVPYAERELGLLLSFSFFGIAPNYAEARTWLDKVAPIDILAQRRLAFMLLGGLGGAKDADRANRLFRTAAERGDATAAKVVGNAYETGDGGVAKNPAEAARMFRIAANQGDVFAERKLAAHLEKGEGVPTDVKQATRWYALAAAGGDTAAQGRLRKLDPVAEFRSPKWGPGERPVEIATGDDATAERSRCIAFRVRGLTDRSAPNLPASFEEQKSQSARLLVDYPRDPRVRYARAATLYDQERLDIARADLECAIDDQPTWTRHPEIHPYVLALLARIDVEQNDRADAEKTIAPVCRSMMQGARKLDEDIGLCK